MVVIFWIVFILLIMTAIGGFINLAKAQRNAGAHLISLILIIFCTTVIGIIAITGSYTL